MTGRPFIAVVDLETTRLDRFGSGNSAVAAIAGELRRRSGQRSHAEVPAAPATPIASAPPCTPDPDRAAAADPEPKPPEARGGAVDGGGSSGEANSRQSAAAEPRASGLVSTVAQPSGWRRRANSEGAEGAGGSPAPARRCAICGGRIPGTGTYCSKDCGNEGRRRWHAAHPGANRPYLAAMTSGLRRRAGAVAAARSRRAASIAIDLEREPATLGTAAPSAPEAEYQAPRKPRFLAPFDPAVVIRPPRPAPLKRLRDGTPAPFQDDLNAIADHGSPGPLARPAAGGLRSPLGALA